MIEIIAQFSSSAIVFFIVCMVVLSYAIVELTPLAADVLVGVIDIRIRGKKAGTKMGRRLLAACEDASTNQPPSADAIERRLATLEPEVAEKFWHHRFLLLDACQLAAICGMALSLAGMMAVSDPTAQSRVDGLGPVTVGVAVSAVAGLASFCFRLVSLPRLLPVAINRGIRERVKASNFGKRSVTLRSHTTPLLLAFAICWGDFWFGSYLRDCQNDGNTRIRTEAGAKGGEPTEVEPLLQVVVFADGAAQIMGAPLPAMNDEQGRIAFVHKVVRDRLADGHTPPMHGPSIIVTMRMHKASTSEAVIALKKAIQRGVLAAVRERFPRNVLVQFVDQLWA